MASPKGIKKINWLRDEECRLVKALAGVMMLKLGRANPKKFWDACSEALEKYGNNYLSGLKGIYFNHGKEFDMMAFASYIRKSQGVPLTENKLLNRGDKAAKGARDRNLHKGEWNKIERQRDFWLRKLHVDLPVFVDSNESASDESESSISESSGSEEPFYDAEKEKKIHFIDTRLDTLELKLRKKLRRISRLPMGGDLRDRLLAIRDSMGDQFDLLRQDLINSLDE
jgi:hypothetical protein